MISKLPSFYVFTGAPGTGKTTLLKEISSSFDIIHEPARLVLADQRMIGGDGTPETNPQKFLSLVCE